MNLLRNDATEKIAYLIPKPGKSRDDVKALFPTDGDWNTFAAGTSTYLTKNVWYGFFGLNESWMTYDYAQSEAEMLEEEGSITGLKFCPTFCRGQCTNLPDGVAWSSHRSTQQHAARPRRRREHPTHGLVCTQASTTSARSSRTTTSAS